MNFFNTIFSEPYMLQAAGAITLAGLAILKLAGGIGVVSTIVTLLKGPRTKVQ